jgi:hypothetical protein
MLRGPDGPDMLKQFTFRPCSRLFLLAALSVTNERHVLIAHAFQCFDVYHRITLLSKKPR